jgi:hypothetical protein
MYFHTDSPSTIYWLANVLATAHTTGRRVRFDVDSEGNLKVKVGEGMWTAPLASTPDPYREVSHTCGQ